MPPSILSRSYQRPACVTQSVLYSSPPLRRQSNNTPRPIAQRAPPPRRVLLVNDDGPTSEFFPAWASHVSDVLKWRAICCLPGAQQSFVSKSIGSKPVRLRRRNSEYFEVEGASPAACVNLAIYSRDIFPQGDCDLVLSGPNVGHNLGRGSILSSGTVGAAMEGALAGKKAIAISYPFLHGWGNWTDRDIQQAAQETGRVVQHLWDTWNEGTALYNVNVPLDYWNAEGSRPKPKLLHTTIDKSSYSSLYKTNDSGEGATSTYVWAPQHLRVFETDAAPGTDVAAVKDGNISITALKAGFGAVDVMESGQQ